jgi:hypothetical protein
MRTLLMAAVVPTRTTAVVVTAADVLVTTPLAIGARW